MPSERISLTSTLKDSGMPASILMLAADDVLVDLGTAVDVVGLHRQHFLQHVGSRRRLREPRLPFRRNAGRRTAPCRPEAAA